MAPVLNRRCMPIIAAKWHRHNESDGAGRPVWTAFAIKPKLITNSSRLTNTHSHLTDCERKRL
jgi:hypothetical protein